MIFFGNYRLRILGVAMLAGLGGCQAAVTAPGAEPVTASAVTSVAQAPARAVAQTPAAGAFTPSAFTPSAVTQTEVETLTQQEMWRALNGAIGGAYTLGPNDLLGVTVYQHPELSVPSSNSNGIPGALITGDGTASLPLVGSVQLGGLTIAQAQNLLETDFAQYVKGARVNVQLIQAQSLRYYLLGAFASPGVKYPGQTMPLLDALALGGSVDLSSADLYQAYVAHGSTKLPIDLHALLIEGDMSQNVILANGDAIVVPTTSDESAYVFGAVGKPGAIPFQGGALSLLQAIGAAGMDLSSYTDARLSDVRVIRAHGASATFMVVDAGKIMAGEAAPLALEPGDIVFVPPTMVATWNQVIAQILPSLETVSAALQPFVSIKYLQTPTP
jgi:polysaccharide export outer membrane protein